jgi:hypothetical protein
MKMYRGYNGDSEWAVLIFANSAREAKKLLWKELCLELDSFIDGRVSLLRDRPWLEKLKKKDVPHLINDPPSCKACGMWGYEIGEDGICSLCHENEMTQ